MVLTYFAAIKRAKRWIRQRSLDPNVAAYLMQRRLGWDNTELLMHYSKKISTGRLNRYRQDVRSYLHGESPQYIIGSAPFYGYNFRVNHHVLIPRPETEGLVDWILRDFSSRPLNLVDIGTGSGAIAISLKLQRPRWRVSGTDISQPALRVAKLNARLHHVTVGFRRCDLFAGLAKRSYNVIVSNPPYVARDERSLMDPSVIRNEPHLALFAGHRGLAVYQRIARSFCDYLKPRGALYLEIGFREKTRVVKLFRKYCPDASVTVKRDVAGHFRMVKISRFH